MGKPTICICENKGTDQLRSNCEADQPLCFCYLDSTIPLLPKSQISSFQLFSVLVQLGFVSDLFRNHIVGFLTRRLICARARRKPKLLGLLMQRLISLYHCFRRTEPVCTLAQITKSSKSTTMSVPSIGRRTIVYMTYCVIGVMIQLLKPVDPGIRIGRESAS